MEEWISFMRLIFHEKRRKNHLSFSFLLETGRIDTRKWSYRKKHGAGAEKHEKNHWIEFNNTIMIILFRWFFLPSSTTTTTTSSSVMGPKQKINKSVLIWFNRRQKKNKPVTSHSVSITPYDDPINLRKMKRNFLNALLPILLLAVDAVSP